ncbi:MAG: hypothetical protein JSW51_03950 [Gemmatimonadota bacterium]|nr:MAG: hypothetical protein JSW51_03950 [Gemmatimonadota bacterium]
MQPLRRVIPALTVLFLLFTIPQALTTQVTRADSAAVLLDAARELQAEGDAETAYQLLLYIVRTYDGTAAAGTASTWLASLTGQQRASSGKAGLIVWNTLFAGWLGVAVPAAFGAESESAYGAGLLIGAPLGFFGTRAFTNRYAVSSGQAITTAFGSIWGTWQALGWRSVLEIGSEEYCDPVGDYCWEDTPEEAPFTAAVVGGLAGIATGGLIAAAKNPTAGDATLVMWSSFWGTWYGVAFGVLTDAEDDALLTWSLMGGNVGLAASAFATKTYSGSAGRVWMITSAGLAGGLAGVGIDLLGEIDDEKTAILIPTITSAAGLIAGTFITSGRSNGPDVGEPAGPGALINLNGKGWKLALPMPQPTVLQRVSLDGRTRPVIGVRVPVLAGEF